MKNKNNAIVPNEQENNAISLEQLTTKYNIERVDFDDPGSIITYGNKPKDDISNILISTSKMNIKEAEKKLDDIMVTKIHSFDRELDERDKKAAKKDLPIVAGAKNFLTKLGVKKFENEKKANTYQARYQEYCDNIEEVCKIVDEQMQSSIANINLRRNIVLEINPYIEQLEAYITVGEMDYDNYINEINNLKQQEQTEDVQYEIQYRTQLAEVFNDKLDKMRKVLSAYKQQKQVYRMQQNNETIIVLQQISYIQDQKPILIAQGSGMIFNRMQEALAKDLKVLNDATNQAYQNNAQDLVQNTQTIVDLAVNGGLTSDSLQVLQDAIQQGDQILVDGRKRLQDRIESDKKVLKNITEELEKYNDSLEHLDGIIQGINGDKSAVKKLGKRNGLNRFQN